MNRIISIRELALLGILIILAAYYFVVQGPVASETLNLANQRADLQSEIDIASAKAMQVNKMQSELDIIYEKAGGDPHTAIIRCCFRNLMSIWIWQMSST